MFNPKTLSFVNAPRALQDLVLNPKVWLAIMKALKYIIG